MPCRSERQWREGRRSPDKEAYKKAKEGDPNAEAEQAKVNASFIEREEWQNDDRDEFKQHPQCQTSPGNVFLTADEAMDRSDARERHQNVEVPDICNLLPRKRIEEPQ